MVMIINTKLSTDHQLPIPQITHTALHIIYDTIKLLHDNHINIWTRINGTPFNRIDNQIFIFPGTPWKSEWEFVFGEFAFMYNAIPKYSFPLEYVQHVVHDIDDVLTILQTISGKIHFKASLNKDFRGHPLCWFAPLPPLWRDTSTVPCDALDPAGSRYGCFRFTIPFDVLIQRFPTCFILGTRKYNQEHSHALLLTNSRVRYIRLIDKREPVKLTDTCFIRDLSQSSQTASQAFNRSRQLQWLCFHDDSRTKWDHLEFAIATDKLQFDPIEDNIQLDFIDHRCKICVPSLKAHQKCKHPWTKSEAMKTFLTKLSKQNIKLDDIMNIFSQDTWRELIDVQESLRSKRLKT